MTAHLRPRARRALLSLAALMFSAAGSTAAQDAASTRPLESRVTSVGLFKNGLAIIKRSVTLPGGGTFEVEGVPDAVHGTLWVECATPVDVLATEREVEVPTDGRWDLDPQGVLAGRAVSVRLRGEPFTHLTGRVADYGARAEERAWSRTYEQPAQWDYWWQSNAPSLPTQPPSPSRYLALDSDGHRLYVDTSTIAFLSVDDPPRTRTVKRPALRFSRPADAPSAVVDITYLTKGLSFAPSYRLDIAETGTLAIAQTAVIKNELEALTGVEVKLISGFPSMEFSHVLSPLSPRSDWASFFTQLAQDPNAARGNGRVMSQSIASNFATYGGDGGSGAIQPASEGVDLHYQSIGARDLAVGDALHVFVATERAPYERIVEWKIRDTRDEWGRPITQNAWERTSNPDDEDPWDALRFSNPFDFPMTTAPATIVAGDRFQGQRTTTWVNPGEETTVRITKALSLRAHAAEFEGESEREFVERGGRTYRRVSVNGELQLCNHRKEPIELVIRREFSGQLDAADGEPTTKLLERGVYSMNRRQELVWTVTLAPGEERTLTYAYNVLVWH